MLAYVFWHAPQQGIAPADYERNLLAFSRALLASGCEGVRQSMSFRVSRLPWLDAEAGYEDWTVVDGSHVLERLNEAAVSGRVAASHGAAAQQMGPGHGGVYYHLFGDLDLGESEAAAWLSRPRGIDFRPVLRRIAESADAPVSVWRRFMVLGPGSEFVILGRSPLQLRLADGWTAHQARRRPLPAPAAGAQAS